jgi:tripartite-type tricarboxylate transporter receptor subunit TctC
MSDAAASEALARLVFLSAGATQGLVEALQPAFEAAGGPPLHGRFGAVGALKEALLQAQEPCDLFVSTHAIVLELIATGHLAAGSAVPIGQVPTGIAVRAGAAPPDVSTAEALRAALAAAPALYFPDPERATAGIHFARVLARLGLADSTRPRWRTFPNGATAMRELAAGGPPGAIGCTQWSEILATPGVQPVALLPAPFGLATLYTAAVAAGAHHAEVPPSTRRCAGVVASNLHEGHRMSMSKQTFALACALLLPAAALAQQPAASAAADYPNRPVRVIVPFSPGGAVDGPTRAVAAELSKRLKQQFVIENKPGAGATIGAEQVAKAPADGYTLLLASQTNAISATLYPKLSFAPVDDFTGISLLGREPGVLVVHPSLPVKSVAELIALAKERNGNLNFASSGNGSGQHLFMAMFAGMAGIKLTHVPYRGSGQATTDLLAGTVPMAFPGTAGMVKHIQAGKLRPLAVSGTQRAPQLPEVPTLAESGIAGYSAYVWMGLLAPKGTPPPIIDKLHAEVTAALATPEVRAYFAEAGIEAAGSSPAEMDAYFREERDRWARVIKETGAKID